MMNYDALDDASKERRIKSKDMWKPIAVLLSIPLVLCFYLLYENNLLSATLIPKSWKRLSLSDQEAIDKMFQEGIEYVFIGGPHRSGTTILRDLLSVHRRFDTFQEKAGYGEGIFLQDVYQDVGVGTEFIHRHDMIKRREGGGGMGYFAFNPKFHLTENSELVLSSEKLRATRAELFRQWGYYWNVNDETKRVRIEKSPSNMIMSRFLRQVFGSKRTKFIFTSRHPVANAMSQLATGNVRYDRRNLNDLIAHWIRQHEILLEDDLVFLPRDQVRIISLNELTRRPEKVILELWKWILGDDDDDDNSTRSISETDMKNLRSSIENHHVQTDDPDRKWREKFCAEQRSSETKRREFIKLIQEHEGRIGDLTDNDALYSLRHWLKSCNLQEEGESS